MLMCSNQFWPVPVVLSCESTLGIYESSRLVSPLSSSSDGAKPKSQEAHDSSWIGSLQLFATFALSLPAGRWFDAHGMRGPAIAGTVCMTGSLIAVACEFSNIFRRQYLVRPLKAANPQSVMNFTNSSSLIWYTDLAALVFLRPQSLLPGTGSPRNGRPQWAS
jgi:MFS family permease